MMDAIKISVEMPLTSWQQRTGITSTVPHWDIYWLEMWDGCELHTGLNDCKQNTFIKKKDQGQIIIIFL